MSPIRNGHDRQITVGLDIGSSNITCAIGEIISETKRIRLLGIATVPSAGIRRGTITNRDELIDHLENALSEAEMIADTKVTKTILSITGEHIRCLNT
jgi:cell division protein FtsA